MCHLIQTQACLSVIHLTGGLRSQHGPSSTRTQTLGVALLGQHLPPPSSAPTCEPLPQGLVLAGALEGGELRPPFRNTEQPPGAKHRREATPHPSQGRNSPLPQWGSSGALGRCWSRECQVRRYGEAKGVSTTKHRATLGPYFHPWTNSAIWVLRPSGFKRFSPKSTSANL